MTVTDFDPDRYGARWAGWLRRDAPHALDAGRPDPETRDSLRQLRAQDLFQEPIRDLEMARCCLAGLLLLHDLLDDSHRISQELESAEGGYWHGIMHRREGDFSNAKYWFRRVGKHPIHVPLARRARELGGLAAGDQTWDAADFVDRCQQAVRRPADSAADVCRAVAEAEWRLLFDHCFHTAVG